MPVNLPNLFFSLLSWQLWRALSPAAGQGMWIQSDVDWLGRLGGSGEQSFIKLFSVVSQYCQFLHWIKCFLQLNGALSNISVRDYLVAQKGRGTVKVAWGWSWDGSMEAAWFLFRKDQMWLVGSYSPYIGHSERYCVAFYGKTTYIKCYEFLPYFCVYGFVVGGWQC